MFSLEDRLRPDEAGRSPVRDVLCVALLLVLAGVLVPAIGVDWGTAFRASEKPEQFELRNEQIERITADVTGQMASVYLLMSLGMLLCLRRGAIDLSVWALAGLGGVVAAELILAGVPEAAALPAAAGAGLVPGAIAGALVAWGRVPSVVVTAGVGLLTIWALGARYSQRSVPVPDRAFAGWNIVQTARAVDADGGDGMGPEPGPVSVMRPLSVTRTLLVTGVYAAVLLALMSSRHGRGDEARALKRWELFAALCASGALAGAAGALWLLDHRAAPVPTRLVDDLRVPAAAILAGGLLLAGRGRTLLACVCLPGALLLTGVWRQRVWNFSAGGYCLQLGLLLVVTLAAHAAIVELAKAPPGRRRWAIAGVATLAAGIVLWATTALLNGAAVRLALHVLGAASCAAGAALVVAARIARRGAVPPEA